ncbi:hypothetical protein D3C72_2508920 [compost metagenome]
MAAIRVALSSESLGVFIRDTGSLMKVQPDSNVRASIAADSLRTADLPAGNALAARLRIFNEITLS